MTTHRARIPGFENSIHILVLPSKFQRTTVHQYQSDGLTRFLKFLQQVALRSRQGDVRAASSLGTPVLVFTGSNQNDICLTSHGHSLCKSCSSGLAKIAAFGIKKTYVRVSVLFFQPFKKSDTPLTVSPSTPTTVHTVTFFHHRAYQGYSLTFGGLYREKVILILQQYYRLASSIARRFQELGFHDSSLLTLLIQIAVRIVHNA